MLNLIKMDLYRLFGTRSYKIGLLFSLALSFLFIASVSGLAYIIPLLPPEDGASMAASFPFAGWIYNVGIADIILWGMNCLSLMVTAVLSAVFISEEQTNGFVKNIAGQVTSKSKMVLSKFIALAVIALSVILCYAAGAVICGLVFLNDAIVFDFSAQFFAVMAVKYLIYLSVCAIVLFLCTLTKSKSLAIAFGVIFGTGATMIAYYFISLFFSLITHHELPISSFTPDGLVYSLGMNSNPEALLKAVAVGVGYIVVLITLSAIIVKKRDTR